MMGLIPPFFVVRKPPKVWLRWGDLHVTLGYSTQEKKQGRSLQLIRQAPVHSATHFRRATSCKRCRSVDVVRYGTTKKGRQRFWCKDCGRTFVNNNAPPGMRFPVEVIAAALSHFYETASLHEIKRRLGLDHGLRPDHANIHRWIAKYTKVAAKALDHAPIRVGSQWIADETVLRLKAGGGQSFWLRDVIDVDTRFLLASHLSTSRRIGDVQAVFETAERRAGEVPSVIITQKAREYPDGADQAFASETQRLLNQRGQVLTDPALVLRLRDTVEDRSKIMRALTSHESVKLVMEGWFVHYNFFRPQMSLGGMTPAEAAGMKAPRLSWLHVIMSG